MRRASLLVGLIVLFISANAWAEAPGLTPVLPAGYDSPRESAPKGKLDTVSYDSKTTGNTRKCVIYTPPGYSKDVKYPDASISCTVPATTRPAGTSRDRPMSFSTTSMPTKSLCR